MSSIKQLVTDIENTEAIRLVSQALEEIAATQIKSTRLLVQQNVAFFDEIAKVYRTVKFLALKKQAMNKDRSLINKNGKTISILLTSNQHLDSVINRDLSQLYLQKVSTYPTDKLVVGSFGKTYLTNSQSKSPFESVIFASDTPSLSELKLIVDKALNYSHILIYHSKFITVLKQEPEVSDISSNAGEEQALKSSIDYILEPEIDKMLNFFESQILTLLFQAIFLESRLSRTSARMVAMYQSELNAQKIIRRQKIELSQARRSLQNKKILENYFAVFANHKSAYEIPIYKHYLSKISGEIRFAFT